MSGRRILITGGAGFIPIAVTGEVHGALGDAVLEDAGTRCAPVDPGSRRGISEVRDGRLRAGS